MFFETVNGSIYIEDPTPLMGLVKQLLQNKQIRVLGEMVPISRYCRLGFSEEMKIEIREGTTWVIELSKIYPKEDVDKIRREVKTQLQVVIKPLEELFSCENNVETMRVMYENQEITIEDILWVKLQPVNVAVLRVFEKGLNEERNNWLESWDNTLQQVDNWRQQFEEERGNPAVFVQRLMGKLLQKYGIDKYYSVALNSYGELVLLTSFGGNEQTYQKFNVLMRDFRGLLTYSEASRRITYNFEFVKCIFHQMLEGYYPIRSPENDFLPLLERRDALQKIKNIFALHWCDYEVESSLTLESKSDAWLEGCANLAGNTSGWETNLSSLSLLVRLIQQLLMAENIDRYYLVTMCEGEIVIEEDTPTIRQATRGDKEKIEDIRNKFMAIGLAFLFVYFRDPIINRRDYLDQERVFIQAVDITVLQVFLSQLDVHMPGLTLERYKEIWLEVKGNFENGWNIQREEERENPAIFAQRLIEKLLKSRNMDSCFSVTLNENNELLLLSSLDSTATQWQKLHILQQEYQGLFPSNERLGNNIIIHYNTEVIQRIFEQVQLYPYNIFQTDNLRPVLERRDSLEIVRNMLIIWCFPPVKMEAWQVMKEEKMFFWLRRNLEEINPAIFSERLIKILLKDNDLDDCYDVILYGNAELMLVVKEEGSKEEVFQGFRERYRELFTYEEYDGRIIYHDECIRKLKSIIGGLAHKGIFLPMLESPVDLKHIKDYFPLVPEAIATALTNPLREVIGVQSDLRQQLGQYPVQAAEACSIRDLDILGEGNNPGPAQGQEAYPWTQGFHRLPVARASIPESKNDEVRPVRPGNR